MKAPTGNPRRIGLLGGLFDPPHIGHLVIAQWTAGEFKLDKILFIPAYHPPHKTFFSPYPVRRAMVGLSIRNNPAFAVSDIEKTIAGRTYTVEVVRALRSLVRRRAELFLIIGADQWNEIRSWLEPERIMEYCTIVVLPRPGYRIKKIYPFFRKIIVSRSPLIDVSSTLIRRRIGRRLDVRYLVAEPVYSFIKKKRLYRRQATS